MKFRMSLVYILMLVLAGSALADGTGGRLVAVSGNVWTHAPGEDENRARAGAMLIPGTRIRTGASSKAEILLEDGSTIVVQSNTTLQLSGIKRQKRKKTSILIFFGRVWNKVSRALGDQASYEVNTPVVVAGVRGTEFEAAVGDDGSVRIRVQQGTVNVAADGRDETLGRDQEIEADPDSIGKTGAAEDRLDWEKWHAQKREHLRNQGRSIMDNLKERILIHNQKLTVLRNRQREIETQREQALSRARSGDATAIEEIRQYNEELVAVADEIADLGDAAGSQFGIVDRFSELASDARFQMIDGQYVAAEAARMRRIKAMFDEMIAEGTDISMEAMEKMLQEMSDGQRGSLKFREGSAADDLWGDDNKEKMEP
jgi:hypothetical protein